MIGAALLAATGAAVAQSRPNIVVVMGDDHGWPYSGFMGDPVVRTPNLDALAAEGTVFTHGFTTAPVCIPSHQTLLTGVHPYQWADKRAAVEALLGNLPLRQEVAHYRTLPRDLARAGYRSFQGGKLWEGDFRQAGFTDGTCTAPPSFFVEIVGSHFGRTGIDPLRAFLDDVGTQPFLVWFAPTLPHVAFDAPQEFRTPYEELGRPRHEVDYYANVSRFDAVVGELLTELDQRGLRESTLVVYLSDNGWELGVDNQFGLPLLHGKGTVHELGNRTPIILRWPGTIPAGVRRDDLVSSEDLVPTLLEFAGADPNPELRGRSLVDAVRTGAPVGRDRVVTAIDHNGGGRDYAVRTPEWRYMAIADGHEELYAIATDPYETTDVAATHPELLPGFRADVQAFLADLDTPPARSEVVGRLVDPVTSVPVGGAVVRLDVGAARLESLTDANGWFAFRAVPPGDCEVDRVRGAFGVRWVDRPSIAFPVPLGSLGAYLPLTGSRRRTVAGPYDAEIRGIVRDAAGAPVAADVRARGATAGGRVRLNVLSDDQGRYRVENLPIGRYRLKARRLRYGTATAAVNLVAPGVVVLDLALPPRR